MILKDLYKKDINRDINPAVSAGDLKDSTIKTEIEEYVFTDEIIQGLYDVTDGIRLANASHNGIWISGYYGSGKSHFLKYLNYCFLKDHQVEALANLEREIKRKYDEDISNVDPSTFNDLKDWLLRAQVDTILFNIGTVHNSNTTGKNTFVEVFWNEFNKFRGFNQFNLSLAQYLEKPLAEAGVFDAFKKELDEDYGWDWNLMASDLAQTELDTILEIAKKHYPTLSIDSIRERIVKNDFVISVEKFKTEMIQYIGSKGSNYRLVFFVDEVSQFINNHKELLLQLQEIVTGLHDASNGKIWVACTAQQNLEQIVSASQISQATDDYGKIMGRFEVKVSLGKTAPEYITKVRLLEKNGTGEVELNNLYAAKKTALETQFKLPVGYNAFTSQEDFTDFYPFVPYQFSLITQVLDNFVELQFVDKEKKGTERSIIKITHRAAKESMDAQVGTLISFDRFYNAVFDGGLTIIGQRSISNAINVINSYSDREFGRRVVNVLFMICHMSDSVKVVFPATIDNLVNLLMTKVDDDIRPLREKIESVLDFLEDNNIIRNEKSDNGVEFYNFYTEDEREVATLIGSQTVDDPTQADVLKEIIEAYVGNIPNRSDFFSRKVSIGMKIYGRQYLTTNNPDIWIEFVFEDAQGEAQMTLQNQDKQMLFYMADQLRNNTVKDDLYKYCQTNKYLEENTGGNEARIKANNEFRSRAAATKKALIEAFKPIIDSASVISGQTKLTGLTNHGKERFNNALALHLETYYPYAHFASGNGIPVSNSDLADKIKRPLDNGLGLDTPLSFSEERVDEYLGRINMTTRDIPKVVDNFEKAPYGWSKVYTIFILNELVRRRKWAFCYNNVKNITPAVVASNIMTDTSRFTMESADVIPAALVRQFTTAWDEVFGIAGATHSTDAYTLFEETKTTLEHTIGINESLYHNIETYPFKQPLYDFIEKIKAWAQIRDITNYFNTVIADSQAAKELADKRKQIQQFINTPVQKDGYVKTLEYVNANKDNFEHLQGTAKTEADELKKIITDEWPLATMRTYGKLKNSVEAAVRTIRQEYINKINEAYNAAYADLKKYAAEEGVDDSIIETADHIITSKTITTSLDRLKANADTSEYWSANVNKVVAEKARLAATAAAAATPATPGTPATPVPGPRTPVVRPIRLTTRSMPMHNESDVDSYLEGLKRQIMSHIDNNETVTIS